MLKYAFWYPYKYKIYSEQIMRKIGVSCRLPLISIKTKKGDV
jgi:hypothetical protein